MFDDLRVAVAGVGNRGLSAVGLAGASDNGWAVRFGRWLRTGAWRVRSSWWPILQTAVAASAA